MHIEKADALMFCWKSEEQRDYAVKLIHTGYALSLSGVPYFGPDDMESCGDCHLPGIVCRKLLRAEVMNEYKGFAESKGIEYGRRKSKAESRNGAKIQLYYLPSLTRAATFIDRNGGDRKVGQLEMFA